MFEVPQMSAITEILKKISAGDILPEQQIKSLKRLNETVSDPSQSITQDDTDLLIQIAKRPDSGSNSPWHDSTRDTGQAALKIVSSAISNSGDPQAIISPLKVLEVVQEPDVDRYVKQDALQVIDAIVIQDRRASTLPLAKGVAKVAMDVLNIQNHSIRHFETDTGEAALKTLHGLIEANPATAPAISADQLVQIAASTDDTIRPMRHPAFRLLYGALERDKTAGTPEMAEKLMDGVQFHRHSQDWHCVNTAQSIIKENATAATPDIVGKAVNIAESYSVRYAAKDNFRYEYPSIIEVSLQTIDVALEKNPALATGALAKQIETIGRREPGDKGYERIRDTALALATKIRKTEESNPAASPAPEAAVSAVQPTETAPRPDTETSTVQRQFSALLTRLKK